MAWLLNRSGQGKEFRRKTCQQATARGWQETQGQIFLYSQGFLPEAQTYTAV